MKFRYALKHLWNINSFVYVLLRYIDAITATPASTPAPIPQNVSFQRQPIIQQPISRVLPTIPLSFAVTTPKRHVHVAHTPLTTSSISKASVSTSSSFCPPPLSYSPARNSTSSNKLQDTGYVVYWDVNLLHTLVVWYRFCKLFICARAHLLTCTAMLVFWMSPCQVGRPTRLN